MTTNIDLGGNTLIVEGVNVGATGPGQTGTSLSSTELALLDTVSATTGVVASKVVVANSSGYVPFKPNVIRHTTGSTLALTAAQSGAVVLLDKADGVIVTLPAAALGLTYRFVAVTSVTSNNYKISTATQGTEFFDGTVQSLQDAAVASAVFSGNGSTHDNITMDGVTQGGLVGTDITIICGVANKWTAMGTVRASGTEATPFTTT